MAQLWNSSIEDYKKMTPHEKVDLLKKIIAGYQSILDQAREKLQQKNLRASPKRQYEERIKNAEKMISHYRTRYLRHLE